MKFKCVVCCLEPAVMNGVMYPLGYLTEHGGENYDVKFAKRFDDGGEAIRVALKMKEDTGRRWLVEVVRA